MNDKELLEFAAKAAGLDIFEAKCVSPYLDVWHHMSIKGGETDYDGNPVEWNPLTDDGDALRLAVKLGFMVNVVYVDLEKSIGTVHAIGDGLETAVQDFGEDSYAATRSAIARAAASIGKAMP